MIYLNLELTDRCNLRWVMCDQAWTANVHDSPDRYMAEETWQTLLEGLAGVDEEISLCPHWLGDPTVHPRFGPMLRWAFDRNGGNRLFRHFKLHTNGVLLDRDDAVETLLDCAAGAEQRQDTFQFVHFSLDAHTADTWRRVKGTGGRRRAYDNVIRLLAERRERGLDWPKVTVAFVVMEENRADAAAFLAHWREELDAYGDGPQVLWDWPVEARDSIYFRRLNHSDQQAADRVHQEVLLELGLIEDGAQARTMDRSF